MNRKLLEKLKEAIANEKTDYALGILDTLIDTLEEDKIIPTQPFQHIEKRMMPTTIIQDESSILDMEVRAKLDDIKKLAQESQ